MEKFLAIALGGALGAILRVYVSEGVVHKIGLAFPYGTMAVNLIGCLLIGLCLGAYILRPDWPEWIRFLLVAGGLGAFTTFSTFAFELLDLLLGGQYGQALMYGGIQLIGGLLLCWVGILITRAVL